jgi:hypothetical protein
MAVEVGTWCGPGNGQGSVRHGIEVDAEEWTHGMYQATIGEAVGVASRFPQRRSGCAAWTRQTSERQLARCQRGHGGSRRGPNGGGGGRRGGVGARVKEEMIVSRVRV